jgi:hypothetical protein
MTGDSFGISRYRVRGAFAVLSVLMATWLTGCSSVIEQIPQEGPTPAPNISEALASIKTVAGQYHVANPLEFSGPIEAGIESLVPWIICLRSAAVPGQTYALFYDKDDKYVSSRISTLADRCDGEAYSSLPN